MPCRYEESPSEIRAREQQNKEQTIKETEIPLRLELETQRKELDLTTRLLCGVMTYLMRIDDSTIIDLTSSVDGLNEWWTAHQEADKRRLETLAQEAIKKLSDEELEALKSHLRKGRY
jgi:hypothetical protein